MKNITVILPIHKIDDDYSLMLKNAVLSVEPFHNDVKLMIVCPVHLKKDILDLSDKLEVIYEHPNSSYDFSSQINHGILNCDTEWFSILEVDDEYLPVWLKSMNQYMTEYSDVSVFLPVVKDVNTEGKFLSFTNESAWAYGFTDKQGYIDNEILLDFQNYQISGGLYKTKEIKEVGMLKDNIQLTFGYEFLLRITYNSLKVMVVPRIGYQHVNFREDSLFWTYQNAEEKLTEKEVEFWLNTAKKEFFFKNKREIIHTEN